MVEDRLGFVYLQSSLPAGRQVSSTPILYALFSIVKVSKYQVQEFQGYPPSRYLDLLMRISWQSILGPVFWIAATAAAMSYGPELLAKMKGESGVRSQESEVLENLNRSILGQESENNAEENGSFELRKIIPQKLPATPQEVPQFVREIIERITNTVIEKGQSQVEEKKTEVVKSTCGQIIAEIEKQCNISTSNQ